MEPSAVGIAIIEPQSPTYEGLKTLLDGSGSYQSAQALGARLSYAAPGQWRGAIPARRVVLVVLAVCVDDEGALDDVRVWADRLEAAAPAPQRRHRLTPHEIRVLRLLADGHSRGSAARALGVSKHTVSFHLRRIYEKLQVHSKIAAIRRAWQFGELQ